MKTLQKIGTPEFASQDTSISIFGITDAVSRNLLVSSAISGQPIFEAINNGPGLTAASFYFPDQNNILTNPLTYPRFKSNHWMSRLVQRGYKPKNINDWAKNLTLLTISATKENHPEWSWYLKCNYDKIGSSDVSLNLYDAINDLRAQYVFTLNVPAFLLNNQQLITFLKHTYSELFNRFPNSSFGLDVKSDLLIDNWETLFISITNSQDLQPDLQKFISEWMFIQNSDIRKLVTIIE